MKSLVRAFIGLDIYGHAVTVNYRGASSYKTKLGAFLTIITYVTFLTYAAVKSIRLVNLDRPEIIRTEEIVRLRKAENLYNLQE